MKTMKKLAALLLAFLLVAGIFAVGGSASGTQFFAAKDEAGKYTVYKDAIAALGTPSEDSSLITKYYNLQRAVNKPVIKDDEKEQYEADKAELAAITPQVNALFATLSVAAGDTFVANSWFQYTGPNANSTPPKANFDKNSVAWVSVKFLPGVFQNLTYSEKYNQPKKEVPKLNPDGTEVMVDGKVVTEPVLDTQHALYCDAVYPAFSAGTNVIDRSKTVFAGLNEGDEDYFPDGTTQMFSYYTLGRFGYLIGSPVQTAISDNTVLTIPGIGGKAMGIAPNAQKHPVTGADIKNVVYSENTAYSPIGEKPNDIGSYPFIPQTWKGPSTTTNYVYNSEVYEHSPGTFRVRSSRITFFGDLNNTATLDELIPIDFACEYKGENGPAKAVFDGWRIVEINNNPNNRGGAYSAGEPYNNYEITLEAQWKPDSNNPPPVYTAKEPNRTWNWLKERLTRWAINLTATDEFGDPVPFAGNLLKGLLAWLVPFVNWIAEVTNVDLMGILKSFGISF